MTYDDYIHSNSWHRLRQQCLERDGHRCRTCNSPEDLEAHHRSYPASWDQDCLDNLTTLCRECHEVITSHLRSKRYAKYKPNIVNVTRITPGMVILEEKPYAVRLIDLQDSRHHALTDAQLAIGRSEERARQEIEKCLQQACQDGCRSRRAGQD